MRKLAPAFVVIVAALAAGCTIKDTDAPPLTGPSEFALRLALQSIPDSILQDGTSQASIQIEASGHDGRPVRNLAMRIETAVDGTFMDFGTLSARTAVTGEDGRARIVYTAPPRPAESIGEEVVVVFVVTPIGSDYGSQQARTVALRLVPPGVILPPNTAPQPEFSFSPASPLPLQDVVFDASGTTDEGRACGAACTYSWEFGDGKTGAGVFVRHQYQAMGTYQARLTATDARGASATVARVVTVGAAVAPTAAFTFSPTSPAISQDILFNATASTAAAGRRLVSWDWDFGTGRTGSGVTVMKRYDTPGTYVVTLTVTDDAGAKATTSQTVTVGGGGTLQATLTVSPTGAAVGTSLSFDGRQSTGPSPIVQYQFVFGDGSPDVTNATGTTNKAYTAAGTYTARLTVTDNAGRTATTTTNIEVKP